MAANLMGASAVLVVDDDLAIREFVRAAVEDAGYVVYEAPDGQTALNRLRTSPAPLVVVLDWMMPGIDGLQVLRALHTDAPVVQRHAYLSMTAALHDPPIANLSMTAALHDPPIANLSLPNDVPIGVLHKPFDLDDLLASVAQMAARLTLMSPDDVWSAETSFA